MAAFAAVQPLIAHPVSASIRSSQDPKRKAPTPSDVRVMARRAIGAVGLILVSDGSDSIARPRRPRGSGVVVRKDGLIATNYHVIARQNAAGGSDIYNQIFFRLDTEEAPYRLKVLATDQTHDLALLRIEGAAAGPPLRRPLVFPAVEIAGAKDLKLLDEIVIIGFPETGGPTVTVNVGVVEGIDLLGNWIKTDARLIHGNSGGAAVNKEGKLVGLPTKVIVDGDGSRQYGAVGFLRPAHLVSALIARSGPGPVANDRPPTVPQKGVTTQVGPGREPNTGTAVTVQGLVRSALDGKPVAGARVGLVSLGTNSVTESNLISWGGSDPEGLFVLNKPVLPGKYMLRAKAIGYELLSVNVEIGPNPGRLAVDLRPSQ